MSVILARPRYAANNCNRTMPLARLSPERIDFRGPLTAREVDSLADGDQVRFLQTSSPVDLGMCDLFNEALFSPRSNITLRLYGFYSSVCDLSLLSRLPNVQEFTADCL